MPLQFRVSMDDADFSAALRRMEARAQYAAKNIKKSFDGASPRGGGFNVGDTKPGLKALGFLGAGFALGGADDALLKLLETGKKYLEVLKQIRNAENEASAERAKAAETGFNSRLKGIEEYNKELERTRGIQNEVNSSLRQGISADNQRKAAIIDIDEATGKISEAQAKSAKIALDYQATLEKIVNEEGDIAAKREDSDKRIARLQFELVAAKNAQFGADRAIRDAGEQQAAKLEEMIQQEQERLRILDAQAQALKDQRAAASAVQRAQVAQQQQGIGKDIEENMGKLAKDFKDRQEDARKIGEAINDGLKDAIEKRNRMLEDLKDKEIKRQEEIEKKRQEAFDKRVNNILSSPDERRQQRRDDITRSRAERRAQRDIEHEARENERRRRTGVFVDPKRNVPMEKKEPLEIATASVSKIVSGFKDAATSLITYQGGNGK